MIDPVEFLTCAILLGLFAGIWLAVRECANAVMHGNRHWWKKAIYLAQQRGEYREFCKQLDEVSQLERMGCE